jgi:hypothetical protein
MRSLQGTHKVGHILWQVSTLCGALLSTLWRHLALRQIQWGTRWNSMLRQYATSRKVVGSIPDEVIRLYDFPNPSGRTMALGSTQPITEMSTTSLPGSKGQPARKAENFTAICDPIV